MSGELTARDVIAAHQRLSKGSCSCGQKFAPDGRILDEIAAEHLLAALEAAGLKVTEKTSQWEWGIRWKAASESVTTSLDEAETRRNADPGGVVVRRRPAGAWEVAP